MGGEIHGILRIYIFDSVGFYAIFRSIIFGDCLILLGNWFSSEPFVKDHEISLVCYSVDLVISYQR